LAFGGHAPDAAQIALDGTLSDGDAELEKLAADALGTPEPILGGHASDERNDLPAEAGTSRRRCLAAPPPEEASEVTVPSYERFGLYQQEGAAAAGEERGESDEEDAVRGAEPWLSDTAGGNHELMAEEGVFGHELVSRAREVRQRATEEAVGFVWAGRDDSA
jgi:hypothetical protein